MRSLPALGSVTIVVVNGAAAVVLGLAAAAFAQSSSQIPHFSPTLDTGWVTLSNDYFPPASGAGPVTFDASYPYVPNRRPEPATYRVADLTNPNLKPWAIEQMKAPNQAVIAGDMGYTPRSACMPAGLPTFLLFVREPVYILQARGEVLIVYSGDAQIRRIHMDASHPAHPKPSWYGDSVGHYEGDTLVIDTIGLDPRSYVDLYRTPHSESLHVVERWRMTNDGNEMEVHFTVEDQDTFNAPWSGTQRYRQVQKEMEELPCAENNRLTVVAGHKVPVATKLDF